ncbi:hypothetical protein BDN72DRAFT_892103 [Pluteus cervinus]|uniref:Uncharacterized protein n=1 Tax=Pluteus cervinus TaxID=181527 RepID=A0ACD3BB86_9AGAR|nr:hypothetical protein BDN72DRAFT_892103 [Pluteus cervinus]
MHALRRLWVATTSRAHGKRLTNPIQVVESRPVINELPDELLQKVFSAYADTFGFNSCARMLAIVRLGHVCRRWKSTLFDHHVIWSSIFIDSPTNRTVGILDLFLKNSASYPLYLVVFLKDEKELENRNQIIDEILKHTHRWKTICLSLFGRPYKPLCEITPGSLPQLRFITLFPWGWDQHYLDSFWSNVCHTKHTELTYVVWAGLKRVPLHAPWHQLRGVSLNSIVSLSELLHILPQCQSCTSLSLFKLLPGEEESCSPASTMTISLPALLSLEMGELNGVDITPLVESLHVPNLSELKTHFLSDQYRQSLLQMLIRSQSKLEKLSIKRKRCSLDEPHTLALLKSPACQTVTRLSLDMEIPDEVMKALASRDDGHVALLPGLNELNCSGSSFTDGLLSDILKSRLPFLKAHADGSPAFSLTVRCSPRTHPIDKMFITKAQADGLIAFEEPVLDHGRTLVSRLR